MKTHSQPGRAQWTPPPTRLVRWTRVTRLPAATWRCPPTRRPTGPVPAASARCKTPGTRGGPPDRKSTRLNSSHPSISYAVFCLKKKKIQTNHINVEKKKNKQKQKK